MQVTTTDSHQEWQSPDGQKTIWQVTVKEDTGKEYNLKTFSEKISKVGWSGDVESYVNARGDRFIRQKAKEGGGGWNKGGASTSSSPTSYTRDDNAIRAQWAIGQAVSAVKAEFSSTGYYDTVQEAAIRFYAMVDAVKGGSAPVQATTAPITSLLNANSNEETINLDNIPF